MPDWWTQCSKFHPTSPREQFLGPSWIISLWHLSLKLVLNLFEQICTKTVLTLSTWYNRYFVYAVNCTLKRFILLMSFHVYIQFPFVPKSLLTFYAFNSFQNWMMFLVIYHNALPFKTLFTFVTFWAICWVYMTNQNMWLQLILENRTFLSRKLQLNLTSILIIK